MKRVLYIDIPFWGIKDGGANRSSFLWNSLIENYEVDWLEIKRSELPAAESMPPGLNDHYYINAKLDKRPFKPVIIYRYSKNDILKFYNIIKKK